MLNKNLEENQIKIALQEVKDAMKSSHEMGNVLDEKTHSIIKVMLSIIFGLSVFIFVYESSIKILFPSFISGIKKSIDYNTASVFVHSKSID